MPRPAWDDDAEEKAPPPAWLLSWGVGGVIMRKDGTGAMLPPPMRLLRCERLEATLELLELGAGIDVCDPRSERGGEREKSTGDVPNREDESSLFSLDSDRAGVASNTELVASSRSLDCWAVLGR